MVLQDGLWLLDWSVICKTVCKIRKVSQIERNSNVEKRNSRNILNQQTISVISWTDYFQINVEYLSSKPWRISLVTFWYACFRFTERFKLRLAWAEKFLLSSWVGSIVELGYFLWILFLSSVDVEWRNLSTFDWNLFVSRFCTQFNFLKNQIYWRILAIYVWLQSKNFICWLVQWR